MDLKTEFENQLSKVERELFRKSDTAYYIGYSNFLEKRLKSVGDEMIVELQKHKEPCETCTSVWESCGCVVKGVNKGLSIAISKLQQLS